MRSAQGSAVRHADRIETRLEKLTRVTQSYRPFGCQDGRNEEERRIYSRTF